MTDGTFGDRGHLVSAVGTRRGALAALLAAAAGVQTAQGSNTRKGKHNRGKNKGGKRKNHPGAGDTPLPHVTYANRAFPIPNQTGDISAAADCPARSVPIGGVWEVEGVTGASLIKEEFLLTSTTGWEVLVNIPTASADAVIAVTAICLEASFVVEGSEEFRGTNP